MELIKKVVILPVITKLDIPTERILKAALESDLQSCAVLGFDSKGEVYLASSLADGGDLLWLMAVAKKKLMED